MSTDWSHAGGRLLQDGEHLSYFSLQNQVYVRDGGNWKPHSRHFLDVGVMGDCLRDCPHCYMTTKRMRHRVMEYDVFDSILQTNPNAVQIALGGAGDPLDYGKVLLGIGRESQYGDDNNTGLEAMLEAGSLENRSMAVTTRPRTDRRGFLTPELIGSCAAIGLSVDSSNFMEAREFLREISLVSSRESHYPRMVLHQIVGGPCLTEPELMSLLTVPYPVRIDGILFLAAKSTLSWAAPVFATPEDVTAFCELVARIKEKDKYLYLGIDACLVPYVVDRIPDAYPLHPCDAGQFSAYIDCLGYRYTCSCADHSNTGETPCASSIQVGLRVEKREVPSPALVIQKGPMTNSSSASYFCIGAPAADYKLPRLHLGEYQKSELNRYFHNNRLIEVTVHDWAAWCAEEIESVYSFRGMEQAVLRKQELDVYTRRILSGEKVYYLVANRDDGGVSPTHYCSADIVFEKDKAILLEAGESH